MEDTNSGDGFTLSLIFSWMVFCPPADSYSLPYPTASDDPSLFLCYSIFLLWLPLIFFSLTFLLHFTHLLFDLYFAFSGALSISIWPSTAISICNFSILNCLPLFISSLTIPLYHRPMPSACLILPCPIYACNIISRFRLFSTSATYLYLPCATKLNCWQSLLDFCLLYLLYMAAPLTNLRYCIHLLCTQPCTCWLAHIASFILLCIW